MLGNHLTFFTIFMVRVRTVPETVSGPAGFPDINAVAGILSGCGPAQCFTPK
jgi:hypothetical protein